MRHYLEMVATFKNRDDNYVHEETELPDELILQVKGDEILSETSDRVGAIINFHIEAINENSASLIKKHSNEWPDDVTHKQKQYLYSVPVFEVSYKLSNGESGRFWVYGLEKTIYSLDYPAQCCCCCLCNSCGNCVCCNSCTIL